MMYFPYQNTETSAWNFVWSDSDKQGTITNQQRFDPWGRRVKKSDFHDYNVTTTIDPWLIRGYTGHEHLDYFELINMNNRMYDPIIGRMCAVDNFVSDPTSLAGYNRYTYALNNPLKYTDPDGEIAFLAVVAIGAAVFGTTNLALQAANGEINNFGDGLKAFGAGAIAGAAITAGVTAGLGVPVLGTVIKGAGIIYGGSTAIGLVANTAHGIATGDWSRLGHTAEIFAGNFYLDGNRSFLGQSWQGISRFSWELPQSTIGHGFSQFRNTFGDVNRVDYYGGVTFSSGFDDSGEGWFGGVSIGNHINIRSRVDRGFNIERDGLLQHEYGHTFDSQIFGPLYLPVIGIPSASGADWTETRADNHWIRYQLRISR